MFDIMLSKCWRITLISDQVNSHIIINQHTGYVYERFLSADYLKRASIVISHNRYYADVLFPYFRLEVLNKNLYSSFFSV